jgi:hypothetical protein
LTYKSKLPYSLTNLNTFKLTLLLLIACLAAKAQSSFYQPFSIGTGFAVTQAAVVEKTLTTANAVESTFGYYFTPFTSATLEMQIGQLTGGDAVKDASGKQFINTYVAAITHADVQLGEFIDYEHSSFLNGLKNIHLGTGIGVLLNNITAIATANPTDSANPYTYKPNSINLLIPARIGYEFKIYNRFDEPGFRVDLNYSLNTAFGDRLDGYSSVFSKSKIAFYNYVSVGLKFCFGPHKQYRKQVFYSSF